MDFGISRVLARNVSRMRYFVILGFFDFDSLQIPPRAIQTKEIPCCLGRVGELIRFFGTDSLPARHSLLSL